FMSVFDAIRTVMLGGFDNFGRLAPVFLGKPLMAVLHLFVWHIQLVFACLMCRDLRRSRAVTIRVGQVGLDLPTTRTGGVEVLARVAGDLGLPASAALDVIPEHRQSRGQLGAVYGGRVLLRAIQLSWLKGADGAVGGFGQIEDHSMRVELRRRIAVPGPPAV